MSSKTGSFSGRQQATSTSEKLPFLATLTIFVLMVPLNFDVGPINLSTSRVLFLIFVPLLTINLLRGKYGKINIVDLFVLFHVFWLTLSIFINNPDVAVTFAGSNACAILGGYLVARASIRTSAQFQTLCKFLCFAALCTLPFAVIETLTNKSLLRDLINAIPGLNESSRATSEQRLGGLYRAQLLFAHPIHYGFFCSLIFSLGFVALRDHVSRGARSFYAFSIGLCCFFSLSSGAVLAMAIQALLMMWQSATRRLKNQWNTLLTGSVVFYIVAEIASDRPAIIAILSRLAFNSSTVSIRQRLFEYGTEQIGKTPVFGVGYNDWGLPPWMSGSIDNFWLLQALVYGIPSLIALAGATIIPMLLIGRRDFAKDSSLQHARLGWIFTMISMCLTLATVAVWGEMHSFVMFILGSGVFMLAVEADQADTKQVEAGPRSAIRYTRFDQQPGPSRRRQGNPNTREGRSIRRPL
ncbi:hypothetical protein RSK20926_01157 [Roseobacter sp. SK209-2-6]|uniref:O-antigen ligase family protein n=1 Tax=Roseobacter sp. SK209-2-6 TaxID=388739 RepID=UPI0000F3F47B|nr:O-antigen ligase family protein [Roseobacter sp. SK209-2-6]EBA14560.1 hypothetical protein RSK20926_01157 [Roseobacter sp. SK209-2-6]